MLLRPWPWLHDLDAQPWPRCSQDIPVSTSKLYRIVHTHTDKHDQMHYSATTSGGHNILCRILNSETPRTTTSAWLATEILYVTHLAHCSLWSYSCLGPCRGNRVNCKLVLTVVTLVDSCQPHKTTSTQATFTASATIIRCTLHCTATNNSR